MQNTIIYLVGFSGSGKYSIAKEICRITNARLVDNHLINNPVFSLIRIDGKTPFPDAIWNKTKAIRRIVIDTITENAPPEFSFIFTNELFADSLSCQEIFSEITHLASIRSSKFIPIRILCDEGELCHRIQSLDREKHFKETSVKNLKLKLRAKKLLAIKHPHLLDLNVTQLTPLEAAGLIISHANSV